MARKQAAPQPQAKETEQKPWEAAGVSRATWYRSKKAAYEVRTDGNFKVIDVKGVSPKEAVKRLTKAKAVSKLAKVSSASQSHETSSKEVKKSSEDKPWLIKPGQILNPAGRPKGTRNKLTQDFVAAMCEDFRHHGAAVVKGVRMSKPDVYLRVIAGLVPAQVEVGEAGAFADLEEAELDAAIAKMGEQLAMLTKDDEHGRTVN